MIILAIETATKHGGLAVLDTEAGLLAEVRQSVQGNISQVLMPWLDSTLKQAKLSMQNIDLLAVSAGPGSFTGLRVGLGTIKGLAYPTSIPVVPVSTLEALAWGAPTDQRPICTMLDARRNEIYGAVFKNTPAGPERRVAECAEPPEVFLARLSELDNITFTGDGATMYRDIIEDKFGDKAIFAPPHVMHPSPAALADLGHIKYLAGEQQDASGLRPLYIRKSEAEVKLKQKKAGTG